MNILGISAFYHDSAAALLVDGAIAAAVEEERFTRIKHDAAIPTEAIRYCLHTAGLTPEDLDHVVFYEKPLLKFERLLETALVQAPRGLGVFLKMIPRWLGERLHIEREMDGALQGRYRGRYLFAEHHLAHAASAFYPSPFDEAAILTLDGVGEWTTASIGCGRSHEIEILQELRFPHSLGLLYSAFTAFTGFRVNAGEYKLMGLAAYGQPTYRERILAHLVDLKEDGSFRLNPDYFSYSHSLSMTNDRFAALFDGPARQPETPITDRERNIASSIQRVTEEIVRRCALHALDKTGSRNLVMSGGVALNCVANGKLLDLDEIDGLWVQPAAGDSGGALGAALWVHHHLEGKARTPDPMRQHGSRLGPRYSTEEVIEGLASVGLSGAVSTDEELFGKSAEILAGGGTVGFFQGRLEFGPRALGGRTILADPRSDSAKERLNATVKFREPFRPFAPAVLAETCHKWFDVPEGWESPYMLLTAPVRPEVDLPAITHADGTARVQTVSVDSPRLHRMLQIWSEKTGCDVLLNTSFNVRGEPIVCTPADAGRCFVRAGLDALIIEDVLVLRTEQKLDPSAPTGAMGMD
jgi:carbamoyltransferase